jgi:sigma-B regulation protein RsbU (phosphoserine phosphatase)
MQPPPAEAVQQQFQTLLRQDLPWLLMGTVLLTLSASAIALFCGRWRARDLALLWFGVFSGLYGVRLLASVRTVQILVDLNRTSTGYLASFITYGINVPFAAFIEQVLGRGWRSSIRWLVRIWALFAVAAVASDLARRTPGTGSLPNNILVLLMIVVLLGHAFRRRQADVVGLRALQAGFLILAAFVVNENLEGAGIVPWRTNLEPVGFLLFIGCLGYVAASRSLAREQRLKAIEYELQTARHIQSSILPRRLPAHHGLDLAVRYIPVASVAGDFYDFLAPEDRRLGLMVADVSGHGVPAALIASMVKVAFQSQAPHAADPGRVLCGLNRILCAQLDGQFVTAAYVFLDLDARSALYSSAGHPPLLLWRSSHRQMHEFQEGGLLLGFMPHADYPVAELALQPGDRLLLYTDGILEAVNPAGDFFGPDRLRDFIATHTHLPAVPFADALLARLAAWSARRQDDDLTLLVADFHREEAFSLGRPTPSPAPRTARGSHG